LYLPALGACVFADALTRKASRGRAGAGSAVLAALVIGGMLLSARVAFRWRTPVAHWESTARNHPSSAGAHARLALTLLDEAVADAAADDDPGSRRRSRPSIVRCRSTTACRRAGMPGVCLRWRGRTVPPRGHLWRTHVRCGPTIQIWRDSRRSSNAVASAETRRQGRSRPTSRIRDT
jgi:hypothetical protein